MRTGLSNLVGTWLPGVMLALALVGSLPAQIDTNPPSLTNAPRTIVTIYAADPYASEAGPEAGVFAVRRSGGTNTQLLVFYQLGGTAQNGSDYEMLSSPVLIPAGASLARIVVTPIDDALVEGNETVIARLIPSPLAGPTDQYAIGTPSNAVVTIADNDPPVGTNKPPAVEIVAPISGTTFPAPADIFLAARADDADGYVATVEFFAGTNSLGVTTNNPLSTSPINPFQLTWSNVPPGDYVLTAKATDDDGLAAWSYPVRITVGEPVRQPIVNIYATDDMAAEIPEVPPGMGMPQLFDPAVFTVTRTGNTNVELVVYYRVGGSASNGVDYVELPGRVTIPAGAVSARIEVAPIDDKLVEGTEWVAIRIEAPACIALFPPPPDCYVVGPNSTAVAWIKDDDLRLTNNIPPAVRITSPADDAVFPALSDITIRAVTLDPDGYASTVEFFANDHKIGEASVFFFVEPSPGMPIEFEFQWLQVAAGDYVLSARTRDNLGAVGVSAPVHVKVGETNRPPVTNFPPVVSIVARDPYAFEGTNAWGHNTATFVVLRHGPTNDSLRVQYIISGTASNGVDYEALPGVVSIGAGERSARITVTPIDDELTERIETVALALRPLEPPSPTTPPPYLVGFPPRAAAIIVDNDWPRPPTIWLPDRLFHLCLPATNGFGFRLEASADCVNWVPVCTNVVTDGALHFVDPDAPAYPNRFYRAIAEPDLTLDE